MNIPYLDDFDELENLLFVVVSYNVLHFMKNKAENTFVSSVVDVHFYNIDNPFVAKH